MRDSHTTLTLTGATGSTTFTPGDSGELYALDLKFTGVPGTTVVTITQASSDGNTRTLFTSPAGNTNITYYPRVQVQGVTGSDITGVVDMQMITERDITIAASSSGAGSIVVTFLINPGRR